MSATNRLNSSSSAVKLDLSLRKYWENFSGVIVATYKHGSDLLSLWTIDDLDDLDFPIQIFDSSVDRSSNIAKVIAPKKCLDGLLTWKKHLKMGLEIRLYENSEKLEVLYLPNTKSVKVAGQLSQPYTNPSLQKVKVLIVDDSKVIRSLLKEALSSKNNFEVVAETGLPSEVAQLIEKHKPDVMTLDINMPEMNGVELIEKLGRHRLPATVVVSSLNMNEGTLVMRALENGAFDYIQKPNMEERKEFGEQLAEKLLIAAQSSGKNRKVVESGPSLRRSRLSTEGLIVIGASTGGTEAIKAILRHLPKEIPPVLIVQHIPPIFSKAFAESLDSMCEFDVCEAKDGDTLEPGMAYVAPGGLQMQLAHSGSGKYALKIAPGDKVSGHSPSVDYLFSSVSKNYKGKCMALLLTGMGADGAKGLLELKQKGVHTIAQNEETCVVFGMPKQAIKLEAASKVIGLHEMAAEIGTHFKK